MKKIFSLTIPFILFSCADTKSPPIDSLGNASAPVDVDFIYSDIKPSMDDDRWINGGSEEITVAQDDKKVWIRSSIPELETGYYLYGPLKTTDSKNVNVYPVMKKEGDEIALKYTLQNAAECCRVRIVVGKPRLPELPKIPVPSVTVRNPVPEITVRWRGAVPSATVEGPDIVVRDLPRVTVGFNPELPHDGLPMNVGMDCQISDGEAKLWLQNGESHAVKIWLNYNGQIVGPSRLPSKAKRSIGKYGDITCEDALKTYKIERAEWD